MPTNTVYKKLEKLPSELKLQVYLYIDSLEKNFSNMTPEEYRGYILSLELEENKEFEQSLIVGEQASISECIDESEVKW